MKEKELREKMAGLYTGVPEDTHAAFEYALTHHRETEARHGGFRKARFAVALALMLALLVTGAYAVYRRYSVTDFMGNSSQAFLDHVITLDETYENDLFTMTVNDLVFDGMSFAVALNIDRHSEDIAYYMRTKVTATCAGEEYMVDVEGIRGPDFLAGGMWPEYGGFYPDATAAEQEGFGFDGVLWDWDMNPPPAGEPIDWTMTFTVYKPRWDIVADNDFYLTDASRYDELERRVMEAWKNQRIYMYGGDVNSYIILTSEAAGVPWEAPWEEMVLGTGAFELADVINFHFTTAFDDDVVKEEMIGQRYELGEYAVVIDQMELSFQRISCRMHLDFGREMTDEELKNAGLPNHISVFCVDAQSVKHERLMDSTSIGMTAGLEEKQWRYGLSFSGYADMGDIRALFIQGYDYDYETREETPREDFCFTIELP